MKRERKRGKLLIFLIFIHPHIKMNTVNIDEYKYLNLWNWNLFWFSSMIKIFFSKSYAERLESINYVNIYFFPHPCYHYVLVPGADISKAGGDFLPWVLQKSTTTYTSHLLRSARYEIPRAKERGGEKDREKGRDIPASRCVKNRALL